MTMEMYHWERKHQSDPPVSVSIMRSLPKGDWTVRSEETTLPPEFPTRYDTLKAAMAAADEMAARHFRHDCGESGCGQWMPLPPTHFVESAQSPHRTGELRTADQRMHLTGFTRSLTSGVAGALALTAIHELARRRIENAPRMDQVAMRGLRRLLPGEQRDPGRLHQLALAGDLISNSLYYSVIAAPARKTTWMRAAVLGTAAGLCALLLPERLGLGAPMNSEQRSNQFMTIGWYLAGAVTAALVATATSPREPAS
jgi:hypothetical protein